MKDMVKYIGYLISAVEIENAFYRNPLVKEVAVIGVPDRTVGEKIKAVVVLHDDYDKNIDTEKLKKQLK